MVDLIWLGVALLLAPALGEIAKIRVKAEKGFLWLAGSGVLFLLAESFKVDLTLFTLAESQMLWGTAIFGVIGLIFALFGTILILLNVFK